MVRAYIYIKEGKQYNGDETLCAHTLVTGRSVKYRSRSAAARGACFTTIYIIIASRNWYECVIPLHAHKERNQFFLNRSLHVANFSAFLSLT